MRLVSERRRLFSNSKDVVQNLKNRQDPTRESLTVSSPKHGIGREGKRERKGEKKKRINELTKYARRISPTREITHIDRSILVAQRQQPGQATPSINIPTLCKSEKLHHISRTPPPFRKIAFLPPRFDGASCRVLRAYVQTGMRESLELYYDL